MIFATASVVAQPRSGKKRPPRIKVDSEMQGAPMMLPIADTTNVVDNFVMPENAPYFDGNDEKLYILRNVNIHGVKHINHDIIRSSSGLVPGDSVYLSGSFIQNAMMRLWSQRYFEDIQIGASIEGDNVDLEVMLRERARVMNWAVAGVPKGKSKELVEETLKLKRGHELSDHIIDRNIKLLKEHFGEKGFLDCEIDVKIEPDSIIKQAVNVTFDVKKNKRVRIGDIIFTGNNNFKSQRLARTFKKTHKISILFWQKTKFNEQEYHDDKELLLDFYNSKGYRNANILSDSVYRFLTKRGKERIGILLVILFVNTATNNIVTDKKNDRKHNTDNKSRCRLHEHCNVSCTGDTRLINAYQVFGGDELFILGIVVITAGAEENLSIFLNDLNNTVGNNACSVACGIEEGNNIVYFNILGFCCMANNQIAAFNFRIHRIGQYD